VAGLNNIAADKSERSTSADNVTSGVTNHKKQPEDPAAAPKVTPARKGPGVKEVIPFVWKLVGESRGAILTLFKATERAEVESQFERARSDSYYTNLRILDINEKIKQPPSAVITPSPGKTAANVAKTKAKRKTAKVKKATSKTGKTRPTRKAAPKSPAPTRTTRATKAAKKAKTAKKSKAKVPDKTAKKKRKTAATKSTKKRSAKKK